MTQPDSWQTPPPTGVSSYPPPPPLPASATPNAATKWFLLFAAAALWVCAGRAPFGAGGLVTVVMLFLVLPVIVVYAIVLAVSVQRRCISRGHVVQPWTTRALVASLVGFGIAGFTIIDGSNAPGSTSSMLTAALHADVEGRLGKASYWISGGSFVLGLVAMVIGLALVYLEKPARPAATD